jgi:hypothetical protein
LQPTGGFDSACTPQRLCAAAPPRLAAPDQLANSAGWSDCCPRELPQPTTLLSRHPHRCEYCRERDPERSTGHPSPIDIMMGASMIAQRSHASIPGIWLQETASSLTMVVKPRFLPPGLPRYTGGGWCWWVSVTLVWGNAQAAQQQEGGISVGRVTVNAPLALCPLPTPAARLDTHPPTHPNRDVRQVQRDGAELEPAPRPAPGLDQRPALHDGVWHAHHARHVTAHVGLWARLRGRGVHAAGGGWRGEQSDWRGCSDLRKGPPRTTTVPFARTAHFHAPG